MTLLFWLATDVKKAGCESCFSRSLRVKSETFGWAIVFSLEDCYTDVSGPYIDESPVADFWTMKLLTCAFESPVLYLSLLCLADLAFTDCIVANSLVWSTVLLKFEYVTTGLFCMRAWPVKAGAFLSPSLLEE